MSAPTRAPATAGSIGFSRGADGRVHFRAGSELELNELRASFGRNNFVTLPGFLGEPVLDEFWARVDNDDFREWRHGDLKVELCLDVTAALALIWFVSDDARLFRLVERLSGLGPIGCFRGRVYRMLPTERHHDGWHDDLSDDRLVGMSVNLGREPYDGGLLQLRDRGSHRALGEIHNAGPGDAVLFRIAPGLEHRVTVVSGDAPKTAFAGWFKATPVSPLLARGASARH
jgi:hypothetical protein